MKKKRGFKNCVYCAMYDRPDTKKRLLCLKKSYDEVCRVLNSNDCDRKL
ncbi:hypothetical protein ACTQ6A_10640 [Lachnospiraceae bacterium LCP25S3_G4]